MFAVLLLRVSSSCSSCLDGGRMDVTSQICVENCNFWDLTTSSRTGGAISVTGSGSYTHSITDSSFFKCRVDNGQDADQQRTYGGACCIIPGNSNIIRCCFYYCFSTVGGQALSFASESSVSTGTHVISESAFLMCGFLPDSNTIGITSGIERGESLVRIDIANFTRCKVTNAGAVSSRILGTDQTRLANFSRLDVWNCTATIIIGFPLKDEGISYSNFFYNSAGSTSNGILQGSGEYYVKYCIFRGNSGSTAAGYNYEMTGCWVDISFSSATCGITESWNVPVPIDVCGAIVPSPLETITPEPTLTPIRTPNPTLTSSPKLTPTGHFTVTQHIYCHRYSLFKFGAFQWFLEETFF